MKIEINIKKTHLHIIIGVIAVFGILLFAFAAEQDIWGANGWGSDAGAGTPLTAAMMNTLFHNLRNLTSVMNSDGDGNLEVSGDIHTTGILNISGESYFGQDLTISHGGHPDLNINAEDSGDDQAIRFREAGSSQWLIYSEASDNSLHIYDNDADDGVYLLQEGTSWQSNSDINLKEKIITIPDVLENLDNFRAVEFTWKHNQNRDLGVIAQEIEQSYPLLVSTDNDGIKGVAYSRVGVIALQAAKELKAENEDLRQEIENLKAIVCLDHPEADICQ